MDAYCCMMRAKFVLGIVGERRDMPTPVDVIDFQDFDNCLPDGTPILKIKYCPFCGQQPGPGMRVTHNPMDL